MIDTANANSITIPILANMKGCFCEFSTYFQKMKYSNGVLTIKRTQYGDKHAYTLKLM